MILDKQFDRIVAAVRPKLKRKDIASIDFPLVPLERAYQRELAGPRNMLNEAQVRIWKKQFKNFLVTPIDKFFPEALIVRALRWVEGVDSLAENMRPVNQIQLEGIFAITMHARILFQHLPFVFFINPE